MYSPFFAAAWAMATSSVAFVDGVHIMHGGCQFSSLVVHHRDCMGGFAGIVCGVHVARCRVPCVLLGSRINLCFAACFLVMGVHVLRHRSYMNVLADVKGRRREWSSSGGTEYLRCVSVSHQVGVSLRQMVWKLQ